MTDEQNLLLIDKLINLTKDHKIYWGQPDYISNNDKYYTNLANNTKVVLFNANNDRFGFKMLQSQRWIIELYIIQKGDMVFDKIKELFDVIQTTNAEEFDIFIKEIDRLYYLKES